MTIFESFRTNIGQPEQPQDTAAANGAHQSHPAIGRSTP